MHLAGHLPVKKEANLSGASVQVGGDCDIQVAIRVDVTANAAAD